LKLLLFSCHILLLYLGEQPNLETQWILNAVSYADGGNVQWRETFLSFRVVLNISVMMRMMKHAMLLIKEY
jgi:hypothetical protein